MPKVTRNDAVALCPEMNQDTIPPSVQNDTVVAVSDSAPVSLFQGHQLQVQQGMPRAERTSPGNTFGFLILLACCVVIVYLQRNSEGFFSSVFRVSFDRNLAVQDARVENSQRMRTLLLLQMTAVVSIALFISSSARKLNIIELSPQGAFAMLFLALVGLLVVKGLIVRFLSLVFDLQHELRLHRFNSAVLLASTGLCLLPLSLLLLYGPQVPFTWVIYTGFGLCVFFYLKILQRGLILGMGSSGVSTLHLFYYFCALEILPVFVLIRLAQGM